MRPIDAALAVLSASLLAGQPHPTHRGQASAAPSASSPAPDARVQGTWRATVRVPGGEAPFPLEIFGAGADPVAVVRNADETVPLSSLEVSGSEIVLRFAHHDTTIRARVSADGQRMEGRLQDEGAGDHRGLAFAATRGAAPRFPAASLGNLQPGPEARAAIPTVAGTWAVTFVDRDGAYRAVGELAGRGDGVITGTFVTPTGDYRYLEGTYEQGLLRLSAMDGSRAVLVRAHARGDGTLRGNLWIGTSYSASWTAERRDDAATDFLPDPFDQVHLTSATRKLRVALPDLDGELVSLDDPRFAGKVVVVDIFGTWCPNCIDQAPFLVEWHRRYRDRGLEIVGLAFELSGDPEHDRSAVRRYQERFGIEFPLLISDAADPSEVAEALPDLSAIKAYPTTVFIGRDGKVRRIHSGFAGPGAGRHHAEQRAALEALIEELLAERH